jgi:hypothetical protein
MTYRGYIKNGQITLEQPVQLPEGAQVAVEVLPQDESVLSKLAKLAVPGGLPPDYSQQHDHYVKKTPRK